MSYKTEQEAFWAGEFGTDYIDRNQGDALLASNIDFFSKALRSTSGIKSCIEFGSNIGMNLKAIQLLYPSIDASAIEINKDAVKELSKVISKEKVHNTSILNFEPSTKYDLTLIKGVLIHINPKELPSVYKKLVKSCGRYLMIAEYYNPSPVTITYRGHSDRLFKRDFAGEVMDLHPEFQLIDYGFVYHRAPSFPNDDITWFLLERK